MPDTSNDVEPWELHSELVLVSPEVWRRALELLPERDPDAFLAGPRKAVSVPNASSEGEIRRGTASVVARYGLWRVRQTARAGLIAVGVVVALAVLLEILH